METAETAAAPAFVPEPAAEVVATPAPVPVLVSAESAPVQQTERISAIDALRGFALLGILLMNIIPFSMYGGAYDNPTVTGGATGVNLMVWTVLHVLAEGKMRCLFSLVFGASMLLLTSRLEKTGNAADVYYRRNLWLILMGIPHAYLLWLGEILYMYGVCSLILFPFRKMSAKGLLIAGGVFLVMGSAAYIGLSYETKDKIENGRKAIAVEQSGKALTEEQKDQKKEYDDWLKFNKPNKEQLEKDAKEWRGSPLDVIKARAKVVGHFHSIPFYHPLNWDVWSMMLIGMGLFKLGVLSGKSSTSSYVKMLLIGYGIGIPLNSWTAWEIIQSNFDPVRQTMFSSTYDLGRLSVALGHMALIMLLCRASVWHWITSRLAAVGQMALSNYITHSIVCSFLFTGYGLKWYGTLERHQVYYVVAAIWVFQLIVSPIWLRYYRFGPMEWAWRSLTYWKKQPFRRETAHSLS
ncbi:MAG: DUF418 domain-containing protein [Bryobacteraceae bacterium]|nr:DUF418 domain-containing protein [Bryobacteraceae bacterium]